MSQDPTVEIKSSNDALKILFNLQRFEMTYPRFLDLEVRKLVEKTVLPVTKKLMNDFRYSQKIIDGTKVGKIQVDSEGFLEFEIVSDLDRDGFDVAKGREEGTRDHFVGPTLKRALRFFIGSIIGFSKGHWVKGITRSNVIEKSIEITNIQLQSELNEISDNRLKEMLNN